MSTHFYAFEPGVGRNAAFRNVGVRRALRTVVALSAVMAWAVSGCSSDDGATGEGSSAVTGEDGGPNAADGKTSSDVATAVDGEAASEDAGPADTADSDDAQDADDADEGEDTSSGSSSSSGGGLDAADEADLGVFDDGAGAEDAAVTDVVEAEDSATTQDSGTTEDDSATVVDTATADDVATPDDTSTALDTAEAKDSGVQDTAVADGNAAADSSSPPDTQTPPSDAAAAPDSTNTSCTDGKQGDCGKGEYCKADACGGAGKCTAMPVGECPQGADLVCGCDGNSYGSPCVAAKNGVSVKKKGECGALCGGPNNMKCKSGEACEKSGCQSDAIGACVTVKTPCPAPTGSSAQCGCDSKTYETECKRLIAGVAKLYDGTCKAAGACTFGKSGECPQGSFCEAQAGVCGGQGKCATQPATCTNDYTPVCGCNGTTYGNDCSRKKSGASLKALDVCPSSGGKQGDPCTTGAPGGCNAGLYCSGQACAGDKGICSSKPPQCPTYEDKHCGCDGKTYGNPCLLALAGVNLKSKGACGASGAKGLAETCDVTKVECKPDLYCEGGCAGNGKCSKRPTTCGQNFEPVCDCKNNTHSNTCTASFEGQNVKAKGMCVVAEGSPCKVEQTFCGEGKFCKSVGCTAGTSGKCTTIPTADCPKTDNPVCGCDGTTYSNQCAADTKAVSISKAGKCN